MQLKNWVLIILPCLIILAVAGFFVASKFGLVNYQQMLSKVPFVNNIIAQQNAGSGTESYTALKQENETLKMQVQTLQEEVAQNQAGVTSAGVVATAGVSTAGIPVDEQAMQAVYKNLADYYASMKPESAVAILNNQDPQVAAAILAEMDKDQAGQILAAMDPAQAAQLLKLVADIDSKAQEQSSTLGAGE